MSDIHSIEERVKILEKLLFVEQPSDIPSPDRTKSVLKTDILIEEMDLRMDSVESGIEELDDTVGDTINRIEELETVNMSSDEVTDCIKRYLRIFLRNSLGLEVSFDDKRQT